MGFSGVASIVFILHAIVVLQCFWGTSSREINRRNDQNEKLQVQEDGIFRENMHNHHSSLHSNRDPNDPELQQFFRLDDLKLGGKMPIYFPIKDPSRFPPLLSREEAESIPFSYAHLPQVLKLLSFPDGSPQAKAMAGTLNHCEFEPMKGESKFCATSLESLLDSTRAIFGPEIDIKVATTKHLSMNPTSLLQNYTVVENPMEISAPRIVGCHPLPYPYAVYYCHSQESDNKLFKISLVGENGWKVEALGICHMDTSQWSPDHVAFLVLKTQPGKSSVCHVFPDDNLVWYPSAYESNY